MGFFGLLAFVIIQGVEANALVEGESPDSSFVGRPLVLLLLGVGALVAGLQLRTPPPGPAEQETYEVRT